MGIYLSHEEDVETFVAWKVIHKNQHLFKS